MTPNGFGQILKPRTRRAPALRVPVDVPAAEPAGDPDFLSLEEAAAVLQCGRGTLAAAAEEGLVPGRRLGRHWKFSRRALEEWLGALPPVAG
jgi:excisionase family DNA binding protein